MRATLRLWFVRHGETAWNRDGRAQGGADLPLTARGRAQARRLAARLRPVRFVAAWSSPAVRAVATARAVLACRGRAAPALRRSAALRELSYGACRGEPVHRWPDAVRDAWATEPWWARFPDGVVPPRAREARAGRRLVVEAGESLADVAARAAACVARIVATVPTGDVLVVTHGHLLRALLVDRLGIPVASIRDIVVPNAAVVVLGYDAAVGGWVRRDAVRAARAVATISHSEAA